MMNNSLLCRFLFKVFAQLVSLVVSTFVVLIVPRTIGAHNYGIYGFITDFYAKIYDFLDLGLSDAFFTRLSQFRNERFLIPCFFHIVTITHIIVILFTIFMLVTGSSTIVWPEVSNYLVLWGMVFVAMSWTLARFTKVVDALGHTTISESVRIFSNIIKLALISLLYFYQQLNLENFFLCCVISFLILLTFQYVYLKHKGVMVLGLVPVDRICFYTRFFYRYSSPLVFSLLITSFVSIIQRWILQSVNGSLEQSYFTLANQLAIPCIMFTSAFTPLFHREVAVLVRKKKFYEIGQSVLKLAPLFFFISLSLSTCAIFNIDQIVGLIGQNEFEHASLALLIMLCYPIHQTYGQLAGALYLATSKTQLYKNLIIFSSTFTFILSVFLLLPKSLGGAEMGAVGLSISMIISQFVSVHALFYFIRVNIQLPLLRLFINECIQLVTCVLIGAGVAYLMPDNLSCFIHIITYGTLYLFIILAVVFLLFKLKIPFFYYLPTCFQRVLR